MSTAHGSARHWSGWSADTAITSSSGRAGWIPRLWAPRAERVRILIDGVAHPLLQHGSDIFTGEPLEAGTRYAFLLDDDPTPLPDPRGRRLPEGVHGPSEVVDPGAFRRTDALWPGRELAGSVIYELHIGTFTHGGGPSGAGTLDSAIERLDHLVDLGITTVEVLPVNSFNGGYNWGYDGVGWFAVHEAYGGPEAYARFVDACHAHGLAVIQDVVHNHLGPSGNSLPRFGPYLRDGVSNTWGDSVNLDEPEVRSLILDNVRMWFEEYRVDGLRLDAVHALLDDSPSHILRDIAAQTDALTEHLGRPLSLIAESDLNDPVMITPRGAALGDGGSGVDDARRAAGGYGMTAQWSDDYHHAVHVALTGETDGYYADFASLDALAKTATRGFFHDGTLSTFREREHGAPIPVETPSWRLVTCIQNHDQIGNRAVGDRLSETLSARRLAVGAVLNLCAPFTPMLFMGEEWGASTPWQFFTSHPEPELGEATARGRIGEFARMGWDPSVVPHPQDPATFHRSMLDWSELGEAPHARILSVYRELIRLRRSVPELTDARFGALSAEADDASGRFVLHRARVAIRVNLGRSTLHEPAVGELLFATSDDVVMSADGTLTLPPDSAAITRSPTL